MDRRSLHELQGGLAAALGLAAGANAFAPGCHLGRGLQHATLALPASCLAVLLLILVARVATRSGRARLREGWLGPSVFLIVLTSLTVMTVPLWLVTGACR